MGDPSDPNDAKTSKEIEAGQIETISGQKEMYGVGEKEDVADEILQEEEPKEPRIDVYYVIMAVIMGSVFLGLLLYFAVYSLSETVEVTVKPEIAPIAVTYIMTAENKTEMAATVAMKVDESTVASDTMATTEQSMFLIG